MKAEKLNLIVFSIGGGHSTPKTFQSQWNCISYGELFQENFYQLYCSSLPPAWKERAEKSKCPRACQLALLPEALGCRASPTVPAACKSDPPLTLRLCQVTRPQLRLREWIKGLGTDKLGTTSFRQMGEGLGGGRKNEQSSRKQHLSGEFGVVWFVLTGKEKGWIIM